MVTAGKKRDLAGGEGLERREKEGLEGRMQAEEMVGGMAASLGEEAEGERAAPLAARQIGLGVLINKSHAWHLLLVVSLSPYQQRKIGLTLSLYQQRKTDLAISNGSDEHNQRGGGLLQVGHPASPCVAFLAELINNSTDAGMARLWWISARDGGTQTRSLQTGSPWSSCAG